MQIDTEFDWELLLKDLRTSTSQTERDIVQRDFRTCDCPLTYVVRKQHAALGTAIEVRLCCLAQKVEELAGLPAGTLFKVMEFKPTWEWDCDYQQKRTLSDGTVEEVRLGPPPRWLKERMDKKGIAVRNY